MFKKLVLLLMNMKKVFFACSMRGGYDNVSQDYLRGIPEALEEMGFELMSKHQTQQDIVRQEDQLMTTEIHDRDYGWLEICDFVVAEISNPSLGVGGEISDAIHIGKPVLGLYQQVEDEISSYTIGKLEKYPKGHHAQYTDIDDVKRIVGEFIDSMA